MRARVGDYDSRMRDISIDAAAVAVLLLEGCASLAHRSTAVPDVDARRLANLYALASEDTACASPDLTAWRIDERVWQVTGCGDAREYAIFSRGLGARWQRIDPIGDRASQELGCPAPSIALRVEAHGVMNASGCGRAVVLQLQCEHEGCAWTTIAHAEAGLVSAAPPRPVPPRLSPPAPVVKTLFVADGSGTVPEARTAPIIVVPDRAGTDQGIERALRSALDSERTLVAACGATGAVIRARWWDDRVVRLSLDPPWAGTEAERCLRSTLPTYQVVASPPGEVAHVVP